MFECSRGRTRERRESLQHIPHKTLTSCLWVLLSTQRQRRMRPSHIRPSLCGYGSQRNNPLNNKKGKILKNINHILTNGPFFLEEDFPLASKITFLFFAVAYKLSCVWETFQHTYSQQLLALASSTHKILSEVAVPIVYYTDLHYDYILKILVKTLYFLIAPCNRFSILRQSCPITVCGLGGGKQISSMKKMIHLA